MTNIVETNRGSKRNITGFQRKGEYRTTNMFLMPAMSLRLMWIFLSVIGLIIVTCVIAYCNTSPLIRIPHFHLPNSNSTHPNYPSPTRLIDLTDFQYITNPAVCEAEQEVLAVVLVHTHPGHTTLRQTARDHISSGLLKEIGMRRVFLIGQATTDQPGYPTVNQTVIMEESASYNDLVQGNFIEHYHNLSYKHVMGLTWASRYCPQAKFVIKIDDDITVDLFQIRQMLRYEYNHLKNKILGYLFVGTPALRSSKWGVSIEEYPGSTYPPYASGWCYIAPLQVVDRIVSEAHTFPYFWIDDVFVTGIIAEKLGIGHGDLVHKFTVDTAQVRCCTDKPYSPLEYYCDYIAGYTGWDHQLSGKALDQFRHCYRKGCQTRSSDELLVKKCNLTS